MLNINKKKSRSEVIWYNYVKPIQILEIYKNNFSGLNQILGKKPGGQVL